MIQYDDDISNNTQAKISQLKDTSQIDPQTQLKLWKETLPYRRQSIRNQSTADILTEFPAYSNTFLVFEEVKVLAKIDLAAAIRRQVPQLLNKIVSTPVFITDSPPIQLIKVLCKEFGETTQHLLCDKEPLTPYPTLVCVNDILHVYVDFHSVLSTGSADDAVALLIAMYTIFDFAFDKKSRTTRFLYSILHVETKSLTNSIRMLIKEKNIDIYGEQQYQHKMVQNHSSNNSTTLTNESPQQDQHQVIQNDPLNNSTTPTNDIQQQSQSEINSPDDSLVQHNSLIISQTSETQSTNASLDMNENDINIQYMSSSNLNSQSQTKKRGRPRKDVNVGEANDEQLTKTNSIPLNDRTNSTITSNLNKKKEDYDTCFS